MYPYALFAVGLNPMALEGRNLRLRKSTTSFQKTGGNARYTLIQSKDASDVCKQSKKGYIFIVSVISSQTCVRVIWK